MLTYQKYPPSPLLSPYVECFFVWQWTVGAKLRSIDSPPNGFCSLVINYGDRYGASDLLKGPSDVPRSFMSGQFTTRYQLQLQGKIGMAGIVFKPAGMAAFFKVPMYELAGERLCFEDVFGPEARELIAQVAEASLPTDKAALLDSFLMERLGKGAAKDPALDFAANHIVAQNGIVRMDDLLRTACMSRRNFERKFLERVGVSPKYYARLRRISHICYSIGASQKLDWQRLIGAGDYYDQAHFIKDFRDFMGEAPSTYAERSAELSRFLQGH
ncbi:MAG: AraC family transcriptional regulator [Saprospiraceae bacterium]|nr:AraC family transcriptional regulator [Saprospiraceae bacterium]